MNLGRDAISNILTTYAPPLPDMGPGFRMPSACWVRERNDDPLTLTVSSAVLATGVDTLVSEQAACQLTAFDWGTLATGTIALSAFASGPADALATASTDNLVGIADADVIFIHTAKTAGSGTLEGEAWSAEQLVTTYWAIDIEGMTPRGGPIVIEVDENFVFDAPPADVDGNVAAYDISNVATGDNSLVDVALEALTVEDALSSITSVMSAEATNDALVVSQCNTPRKPVCSLDDNARSRMERDNDWRDRDNDWRVQDRHHDDGNSDTPPPADGKEDAPPWNEWVAHDLVGAAAGSWFDHHLFDADASTTIA
jgi:hypothetical protein